MILGWENSAFTRARSVLECGGKPRRAAAFADWKRAVEEHHAIPRESGAVDAGLRRASLSPHSKTLSRFLDGNS